MRDDTEPSVFGTSDDPAIDMLNEHLDGLEALGDADAIESLREGDTPAALEDALLHYLDHPVEWIEDILNMRLDDWQAAVVNALAKDRFVSVRAGRGVGKSAIEAAIVLWFLCTHPFCKIIVTAPTREQLFDVLWAECYKWIRQSAKLQQIVSWTEGKIYVKSNPAEWFAVARTAEVRKLGKTGLVAAEGLQGRHAESMLVVMDEACHDDQTEVLTEKGWIPFPALKASGAKLVMSLDPSTNVCRLQPIAEHHEYSYVGPLHSYTSRAANFAVTPNHRMWFRPFTKQFVSYGQNATTYRFQAIEDISSNRLYLKRHLGCWSGVAPETFTILANRNDEAVSVPIEPFLALLGWYFSEGSLQRASGQPVAVIISQSRKNQDKRRTIGSLLLELPFSFSLYKAGFVVRDSRLASYLAQFGSGALSKRLPDFLRTLSPHLISIFLGAFHAGDGYFKGARNKRIFYTSSKALADGLQELILLTGKYAAVATRPLAGVQSVINEVGRPPRVITSTSDGYVVAEFVAEEETRVKRSEIAKIPYSGQVYCVTVAPHHLVYTRRDGKCMWSGNSGIDEAIMATVDGVLTSPESYLLMASNPTRPVGTFFDSFHSQRKLWRTFHVNAEENHRVDRHAIDRMLDLYGSRDHPLYMIYVRGEFPPASHNSLFPLALVEESIGLELQPSPYDPCELGVDVARYGGDLTAIAVKHGPVVLQIDTYQQLSTMETCGRVIQYINKFRPVAVKIDVVGVGAGVYDRLHELQYKECIPVAGSSSPQTPDGEKQFINLRAEAHWHVRTLLEQKRLRLPPDDAMVGQMTSITYKHSSRGKLQVESKEDLRDRGAKSPDRLDALVLACMPIHVAIQRSGARFGTISFMGR